MSNTIEREHIVERDGYPSEYSRLPYGLRDDVRQIGEINQQCIDISQEIDRLRDQLSALRAKQNQVEQDFLMRSLPDYIAERASDLVDAKAAAHLFDTSDPVPF